MSNVKLTLRPPPNVDFVHGYPGIPPGQDRQQAAVKGAIEVRAPNSGVKAKWVRIELRKVETLPGGGDSNTFYDYVGPSPVTLWNAPDEYNILRTQDFPFSIRIPESIPPTIALEGRAGIHYELVATVCTKGKKHFLRKRKNIVTKEISPIIIDKHELHSTWPVYCQPEKRQVTQDGVTLIVERSHTCYGPGDRISVVATLKSDNLHTVILRGFEMTLKESTIFRAHTLAARRTAPMVKIASLAEARVAINATVYGGSMNQAELVCQLPANHTTTTLNAARHIDVTYVLSVKALMGTGTHVTMELPVIVSNWQRYVSQEAIRRIGSAPALSLVPPTSSSHVMSVEPTSPRPQQAPVTSTLPPSSHVRTPSTNPNQFNSLPAITPAGRPGTAGSIVDEFGYGVGYGKSNTYQPKSNQDDSTISRPHTANSVTQSATTAPGRRPNSARATNPANRFTITNAEPEIPEELPVRNTSLTATTPARNGASPHQPQKQWLTAEEEKKAYELARSKVERAHDAVPATVIVPVSPPPRTKSSTGTKPWLSAEEEKVLLYEKAQAAVVKAQGPSAGGASSGSGSVGGRATAAELYQQAMANVNLNSNKNQPPTPHISPLSGGSRKPATSGPKVPQYMTADEEKAALRRYEEAKMSVNRVHHAGFPEPAGPAPIAYDSLYPKPGGSSSATDAPPSFEASVSATTAAAAPMSAHAEKAALAEQMRANGVQPPSNPSTPPPPSFNVATTVGTNTPQQYMDAAAEKEALRKKFEAKDAARRKSTSARKQQPPQTPPKTGPPAVPAAGARPAPAPPGVATPSTKVLTAAEEKAMLNAKFEAKDAKAQQKVNGHVNANRLNANPVTPPSASPQLSYHQPQTPPPLMPRPPAEYIQETQEEDARVSKFAIDGASLKLDEAEDVYVNGNGNGNGNGVIRVPGPPPPLPPKPAGE
ncbi:hypothetical protein P691DRAFT_779267 [Macrolepiota fuliginosa MF-IS2]|uniref:Arrestin C-terminal-like domain-containing protein n=1 Tax=Macrolepiota fuliginosa MF-IS2 TaxID=1400762 RepID=A0A9P6BYI1_9AGAR|nr:hypothetical protein P691DRAFT_779267 [Macrolepiota fuliginosa MF-IS2]